MMGEGVSKNSTESYLTKGKSKVTMFLHLSGRRIVKIGQNLVHVVVECPPKQISRYLFCRHHLNKTQTLQLFGTKELVAGHVKILNLKKHAHHSGISLRFYLL